MEITLGKLYRNRTFKYLNTICASVYGYDYTSLIGNQMFKLGFFIDVNGIVNDNLMSFIIDRKGPFSGIDHTNPEHYQDMFIKNTEKLRSKDFFHSYYAFDDVETGHLSCLRIELPYPNMKANFALGRYSKLIPDNVILKDFTDDEVGIFRAHKAQRIAHMNELIEKFGDAKLKLEDVKEGDFKPNLKEEILNYEQRRSS